MMDADWRDYVARHYKSRIMTSRAHLARRASRLIVGLQVVAVIFYSGGVLAANASDPERIEPYARELILKMEFPFNISTEFIYMSVTIIQFYHLMLVGCGITIINSLLVTLVSQNCARELYSLIKLYSVMKFFERDNFYPCCKIFLNFLSNI